MITLEPVWQDSAQVHIHRALLTATAHPGEVFDISRWTGGDDAALGVLATLVDGAVTCADPDELLNERERSLLGIMPAELAHAAFVLLAGRKAPPSDCLVSRGSLLTPERGATVILICDRIGDDGPANDLRLWLEGPGIPRRRSLACTSLDPAWIAWRSHHCRGFPQGIDVVLADTRRIAVLPRTTRMTIATDQMSEA